MKRLAYAIILATTHAERFLTAVIGGAACADRTSGRAIRRHIAR